MARGDIFATTHWTAVLAAGECNSQQADLALEELCRTYWYPLYVYVRRQTSTREDAEDLTQAFFARFLEKNYLANVNSERGRFRAFLLAALKHFLANEWDRANRQKRGGGMTNVPLDWQNADTRYQIAVLPVGGQPDTVACTHQALRQRQHRLNVTPATHRQQSYVH